MEFGVLFTSHPNPKEEPYPHRGVHARTTEEVIEAERLGYDTAEAANGEAALDLLARDSQYDLLISDVRMAPMDGLILLAEVKNQYPDIRVLMTSVHGRPDWINNAMSSGANGFLLKPFIKDQLAEAVESILAPMNP